MPSTYTVYSVPGIDARVALAVQGSRLAVSFLAKGRSRRADRTYTARNPERRALVNHLLEHWRSDPTAGFYRRSDERLIAVRYGRSDTPIDLELPQLVIEVAVALALSRSGNYRLDLVFDLGADYTLEDLSFGWGLSVVEGARLHGLVRWLGLANE